MTYTELNRRANQLAHHLRGLGVGPEVRVGLCMERSPELVIAILGILKAGGAYVPLDPAHPPERLAFILEDAQVALLLTSKGRGTRDWGPGDQETRRQGDKGTGRQATPSQAPSPKPQAPSPTPIVVYLDGDWPAIAQASAENPAGGAPGDLAYVIYTSGSTGQPKGVLVEHHSLSNLLSVSHARFDFHPGDVMPWIAPVVFDITLFELFTPLIAGATTLVLEQTQVLDLPRLLTTLADCTLLHTVPSLMQPLVRAILADPSAPDRFAHMRMVFVGGDLVPPALLGEMQAAFRNASVCVLYGPTEGTILATHYLAPRDQPLDRHLIGTPLPNVQVRLCDPRGHLVPVGVPGELYLGGVGVTRGYWRRDELTAERFVPNPFASTGDKETRRQGDKERGSGGAGERGERGWSSNLQSPISNLQSPDEAQTQNSRLYKTGDLARYRADGNIEFLGRLDQQVKVRGFRIELGEVEAALRAHPAVRDCIVVAREDVQGDKILVAYVVPHAQQAPAVSDLRASLQARLPEYMVPAAFVTLQELPLTANGKIDRQALPMPGTLGLYREEAFVAPRTPLELQLAQIWEDLLERRPVGVTDNFFDLGGHSLLAMRLMEQIRQRFGQDLSLSALFQGATVEHLATRLHRRAPSTPGAPLVAIQAGGRRLPLFCVHPVGGDVLCYYALARQLDPDQPVYGLRAAGLDGEAEPAGDIPAMAARYAAALRLAQPEGPYLLAGWSLGGVIAFEIARQLHAQGQEVALLALLDSRPPTPDQERAPDDDLALLAGFARDLGLAPDRFIPALEHVRRLGPDEQLVALLEQARQTSLLPPDIGLPQLRRLLDVFKANTRAMQRYAPQVYPGRVVLLQAAERFPGERQDPAEGWSRLAAGGVERHTVPGDHYAIVRPPYVQALAARLSNCIDEAQGVSLGRG